MASKVIARLGTKSQFLTMPVPLLVGEYGYETDTRNGVVGDGSTTPPEFMTTKSSGNFDFSGTTTVAFNNITANSYNGVNLAQINAANGLIARTAPGIFAARSLVSNDSSISITYGDGVNGNPNLQVNPNVDLSSGTSGIVLPQGTIAQRSSTAKTGTLRYCVDPTNNYSTPEIYSVDNVWHSVREYVYNNDYVLTVNPNAPANTSQTFPTIQQALLRHLLVDCSGKSVVSIPEGVFSFANKVQISNPNKQWSIQGVAPLTANLMSVAGVTGTNGLWTVVLNLDNVTGINIGNYLFVDSLRGYTTQPHRGYVTTVAGSTAINSTTTDPTSFLYELNVNDFVNISQNPNNVTASYNQPVSTYTGQIQAIPNSSQLQMKTSVPFTSTNTTVYSSFQITGTVYSNPNNPTNIVGVGTIFTQELNVNDILTINNETKCVIAISSDSSLTVANPPVSWPTTPSSSVSAFANNNPELHQGAFKIVAVDVVNKKVTILNNCLHKPPVNKIGIGTVKVIKSVISFNNPADDGFYVQNNSNLDLQNIIILSSSGTGNRGLNSSGGYVTLADVHFSGFNATAGTGIYLDQKSSCLLVNGSSSCNVSNSTYGIVCSNGSELCSNNQIIINNCSNTGITVNYGGEILCYNNMNGVWRTCLSIVDTGGSCLNLSTGSTVYFSIAHFAYSANNQYGAVYAVTGSSFSTVYGSSSHDHNFSAYQIDSNSYCAINFAHIFNCSNTNAYGIFCVNISTVIAGWLFISNVYSPVSCLGNSATYALYSTIYDAVSIACVCYSNSNLDIGSSLIICRNPSLAAGSNIIIAIGINSNGIMDYSIIQTTSSSCNLIFATNNSFASAYGSQFINSNLISPPRNTVGNSNSYIIN